MILELEDVSVGYGYILIVKQVSLGIDQGEFFSLIGPNGAGKTTLLGAISGQNRLRSGSIRLAGNSIDRLKPHQRARLGLCRSFQTVNLFSTESVVENVVLAVQARYGTPTRQLVSRIPPMYFEEAEQYLELVRLNAQSRKLAGLLSHGDKRKLELAMLLALRPKILLLDEPTAGMALAEVPEMLELLSELKATGDYTIVLVEHKLEMVMKLSDRIAVLNQGELLKVGSPTEVMASREVQVAYLGGVDEDRADT